MSHAQPIRTVNLVTRRDEARRDRAVTWAGLVAAVLGLVYAAGKVVMAVRAEVGLPWSPAPAEATTSFQGDLTLVQLQGASMGVLAASIAVLVVRGRASHWLTVGAAGALAGFGAGAVAIATGAFGLREDHGQWGPHDVAYGIAQVAAWAVLLAEAVRRRGVPARLVALVSPAGGAALGSVLYGAMKLDWALGGEVLMRQAPLAGDARAAMLAREDGWVASHWIGVGMAAAGVVLALLLARGVPRPRPLVVWLPLLVGGFMLSRAAWGIGGGTLSLDDATVRWDVVLWSPLFALWGAAWWATVRPLPRVDPVVAWGVAFAAVHAYWAAGGEAGMRGNPAGSAGEQVYIGAVAALGLVAAWAADRRRVRLSALGAALLAGGVAVGVLRWAADGGVGDDGAGGVAITAYFALGAVLLSRTARRGRSAA